MSPSEFEASTIAGTPPPGLGRALAALWWDAKGHWRRAHEAAAADEGSRDAAWVHAYLHRREGDPGNARYWYARAGRPVARDALADERRTIVETLLASSR